MSTKRILSILAKRYPGTGMTDLGNPEDTLIATLLSAQTTDVQVLRVYPGLRKKFPTLSDLAKTDVRKIEQCINSIGLYRNKAKAVKALAQTLLKEFGGKVPNTMQELVSLPGVGRKTASVVLSFSFKQPAIAVDTHVFRIAKRLGWAKGKNPQRVEKELMALIPKKQWSEINRTMVPFGRDVCKAPKPQCWRCPVRTWCPYPKKVILPP
ncbi:endonuclease III [Candidatus Uhrbacteria bacterium]|nr:endonuclease III [Candidatus Uhrbacteria bacterium]